jgi:hypothetical protein
MAQHPPTDVTTTVTGDAEVRKALVRRFARLVSLGLIIICNAIVLIGVWASGINLDELAVTPDVFNSKHDICLRFAWQPVEGAADPMRICSEWINLSDPSGKTHRLQREIKFREGPDGGKYYVDQGEHADYRLLLLVLIVVAVIALGVVVKWYLVSRYRLRLESGPSHGASLFH